MVHSNFIKVSTALFFISIFCNFNCDNVILEDLLKLKFEDAVSFLQTMESRDYDDDKMVNEVLVPCMNELNRNRLAHQLSPTDEVPPDEPDFGSYYPMTNGSVQTNGFAHDDPETLV